MDPLRALADTLRAKGGIEWRHAVLDDQRVEIVRGKDFVQYFVAHPDKMQRYAGYGKPPEEQAADMAELFMR